MEGITGNLPILGSAASHHHHLTLQVRDLSAYFPYAIPESRHVPVRLGCGGSDYGEFLEDLLTH